MKIIVFDKNTSKGHFTNYGYGKLNLVLSCIITEELNGRYDLELEVSNLDSKVKYLKKWAILYVNGQLFRIVNIVKMDKEFKTKILANHIFYDINYGFLPDYRADGKNVQEALYIGLPDEFKNVFDVSSDITELNNLYFVKNNGVENVFGIIDRWGQGELIRDNFSITINKNKGKDKGVTFTYKKIDEIEITEDVTEVITRLYPTGKDGISLKEKYIIIPNWNDEEYPPFHITREVKFEGVETEGELRAIANKEAERLGLVNTNFKINVNDLMKVDEYKDKPELLEMEVGDIATIKHPVLNLRVKVKVIKKTENLVDGSIVVELGQPFKSFFDSVDNGKTSVPTPDMTAYKDRISYYSNGLEEIVKKDEVSICYLRYGVEERTNVVLFFNAFVDCKVSGTIRFSVWINNTKVEFDPVIDLEKGNRLISFSYPLISVENNVEQNLEIRAWSDNGEFRLPVGSLHIMLKGQGVSGGNGGERPHAEVIEVREFDKLHDIKISSNEGVQFVKISPMEVSMLERLGYDKLRKKETTVKDLVDVMLVSTGYLRPIDDHNYIYNEKIINVSGNIMTVKTVEHISNSKISENQFEIGCLQEIPLLNRLEWNSIEESEFINE